jgi:ureidoglycolate dehydrogenase (NAD+)
MPGLLSAFVRVMATASVRVDHRVLHDFVRAVFERKGMSAENAALEADVLVWANLRGVDSHGVLRLPRYLDMIDRGDVNPRPTLRIAFETAASAILDADYAFGPIAMTRAMDIAIEKARQASVGWVQVRHTAHSGAVGHYALRAARADMIGLVTVVSPPNMAYHGARAAGVATSPLAIAVPAAEHAPLMLDMATAMVAFGKITQARNAGTPLPPGVAIDRDGRPTTDATAAVLPLPLGGPKGAGLSLMFECMTSLVVGSPIIEPTLTEPVTPRHRQNGLAVALNIGAFTAIAAFKESVDRMVAAIKALPKAEGVDEILAPGERGDRILVKRRRDGIPLPPGTWRGLESVAARVGLAPPQPL